MYNPIRGEASHVRSRWCGAGTINCSGVKPDFNTKIWMAYNDRTSPHTYQIRIVIRYVEAGLEVWYPVYYEFTIL